MGELLEEGEGLNFAEIIVYMGIAVATLGTALFLWTHDRETRNEGLRFLKWMFVVVVGFWFIIELIATLLLAIVRGGGA